RQPREPSPRDRRLPLGRRRDWQRRNGVAGGESCGLARPDRLCRCQRSGSGPCRPRAGHATAQRLPARAREGNRLSIRLFAGESVKMRGFILCATAVALSAMLLGCGDDAGEGSVSVSVWGEEYIEVGIPAGEFEDGWSVKYDRFLIAL